MASNMAEGDGKQTTQSSFHRSLETLKEFDGDDWSDSESGVAGKWNGEKSLVAVAQQTPTSLLLLATLDHLSSLYSQDPEESRTLFKVLVSQLVNKKVLPRIGTQDEIASLRSQYKVSFSRLVQAAVAAVRQQGLPTSNATLQERARIFFEPRLNVHQPLFSQSDMINFHMSRYQEEFMELNLLGQGAYGSVFKVRHNLDGCEYAIKKISFQSYAPEVWEKIIREVKNLASMTHKNIVRYHCAWLEAGSPFFDVSQSILHRPSHLPAITFASKSSDTHSGHEDDDDSVRFEKPSRHGDADDDDLGVELDSPDTSSRRSHQGSSSTNSSIRFENSPDQEYSAQEAGIVILHIQMELCTDTLKAWILRRNKATTQFKDRYNVIDEDQNLTLLKHILKAVKCIHASDILHRDIKPKNIFLSSEDQDRHQGVVKIGDFGLARHFGPEDAPLTPHPGGMGAATPDVFYTQGVGTTIYAAPEQLKGFDYNEKCDMYSVGLVIFELYQPFGTEMERCEELKKLRDQKIPPEFKARWPKEARYIGMLMDPEPSQRPSAANLLKSDLFFSKDQVISSLMSETMLQKEDIQNLKKMLKERDREILRLKMALFLAK